MNELESKIATIPEKEFSRLKGITYLDHVGATLYSASQLENVFDELRQSLYGNPHSRNPSSHLTTEAIDQVRFRVLQFFNTTLKEYDVIFTSGATRALSIVAEAFDWEGQNSDDSLVNTKSLSKDAARAALKKTKSGKFVYLEDNHTSVLGIRQIAAIRGAEICCVREEDIECCLTHERYKRSSEEKDILNETDSSSTGEDEGNGAFGLFAFPAESNFCGRKYPLQWIRESQNGCLDFLPNKEKEKTSEEIHDFKRRWFCLLDAASYVATCRLDLERWKPDFACLSFYKMFGFPTGLGALLVHKHSSNALLKSYFGGGTALITIPDKNIQVLRPTLHERFEDGTVPFLSILALRHGFDTLERLAGGMETISEHTFNLGRYLYMALSSLRHGNGVRVALLYCCTDFSSIDHQGGIVNFNLLRANGKFIGYSEVENMAALYDIHLRTGCFCNPGACRLHLDLSNEDLLLNYQSGHVCGDDKDLVAGRPTGSVRISFGYMSTQEDADHLLRMIVECFVEGRQAHDTLPSRVSLHLSERTVVKSLEKESLEREDSSGAIYYVNDDCETAFIGKSVIVEPKPVSGAAALPEYSSENEFRKKHCDEFSPSVQNYKRDYHDPNYQNDVSSSISKTTGKGDQKVEKNKTNSSFTSKKQEVLKSVFIGQDTGKGVLSPPHGIDKDGFHGSNSPETYGIYRMPSSPSRTSDGRNSPIGVASPSVSCRCHLLDDIRCPGNHLTNIFLYPLKSCGAQQVDSWPLGSRGLLFDREWVVVNESGITLNQKREAKLVLISPEVDLTQRLLWLHCKGFPSISLPLDMPIIDVVETNLCSSKICGDRVATMDCGDEVGQWLSQVLCRDGCRLFRQLTQDSRTSKASKQRENGNSAVTSLSLANEAQYLLLNEGSVRVLAEAIRGRGWCDADGHLGMLDEETLLRRFRGNLVVDKHIPYDEDRWMGCRIGSEMFKVQGKCSRCQMVCIDQLTGQRTKEPLITLAATRGQKLQDVSFGIYLLHEPTQSDSFISVGDPVFHFT